jgi:ATP-dependent DNA helicase RecG
MHLKLSSLVTEINRIGPAKAKYLAKLGITHIRDFLYTFPRRYDDFSVITPIAKLRVGETMTIRGRIKQCNSKWGFSGKRRLLRIFVDIEDDSGVLFVTWFNLRFLPQQLWQGRELFVAGKVEAIDKQKAFASSKQQKDGKVSQSHFRMRSPVMEFISDDKDQTHTARIAPVYSETYGVSSRFLRYNVKNMLPLIMAIPEYLPADIRKRNKLLGIHKAIEASHFPDTSIQLKKAQRRLKFDELFFLQLSALVRRRQRKQRSAIAVPSNKSKQKKITSSLPFTLTKAQQVAIEEVLHDMQKNRPMNRLLQGDVGSGKSVVALIPAFVALQAGHTVIYLAPTEVLARQQAKSFAKFLGKEKVTLLIGAMTQKEKDEVKSRLFSKEALCVVGTHALLQDDVIANQCALVIVDEQHRFGVKQRHALQSIATRNKEVPHLLSMTATPIPRTLNLTVYGDLDISVLNEMPPGRMPIKTKIILPNKRDSAVLHIIKELHQGRQAYVIAPLIEKSERLVVKSAKETAEEMKKLFPDVAVGLLHGKMPSDQKAQVIRNFNAGALQLLVSTSVVEVGIDVPNATIMIIEGAVRFGLAQLHQFRGRVGRGKHQSYCYLFPTDNSGINNPRLKTLVDTTDGFRIAEEDLKLRGPGELYGIDQSGFGNLKVASLLDYDMIKLARTESERLLAKDPKLNNHIILQKKVKQKNLHTHFE